MGEAASDHGSETFAVRLLVLAGLVAAANAWLIHHAGIDVSGLAAVNAFVAAAALLFGHAGAPAQQAMEGRIRGLLRRLAKGQALLALGLTLALVGSFVSSVRVIAGAGTGGVQVKLLAQGEPADEAHERPLEANGIVRFLEATSPFGRPFTLEVTGYLHHSFDLFPFAGTTIRVDRDLRRAPAVLLRIPYEKFGLLDGGAVVVSVPGAEPVTVPTEAGVASVLIGHPARVSRALIAEWRSELAAEPIVADPGARDEDREVAREQLLRGWRRHTVAEQIPVVMPGTTIEATFTSRDGTPVAGARFVVTSEPVQDVYLERIVP